MKRYGPVCESLGLHISRDDPPMHDDSGAPSPIIDYSSEDILTRSKRRHAHDGWATQVKHNYQFRCAISDISERDFLIAGHIVPWAADKSARLDPGNGICFSVFYDRAFEKGYFTLASDLRIDVAPALKPHTPLGRLLCPLQGKSIRLPRHHRPKEEYLARHRRKSVDKWLLTAS